MKQESKTGLCGGIALLGTNFGTRSRSRHLDRIDIVEGIRTGRATQLETQYQAMHTQFATQYQAWHTQFATQYQAWQTQFATQ